MKKYLIAYYSRTGTSKKAAQTLNEMLGDECVIEEIKDIKKRSGIIGFAASVKDAIGDNITKIEPVKNRPSEYSNVVIITPVWAGKMADALRTYLSMYKSDIKTLILITCAKSSTGDSVQKELLTRFSLKTKTLISLKESDVRNDRINEALEAVKQS